jgi:endonuclease-3
VRLAVASYPKAAVFTLRDRGHDSPFELLVSALISSRTRDEVTLPASLRLFEVARTPAQLAALPEDDLAAILDGVTFAATKARDLKAIATEIVEQYDGQVPDTFKGLIAFRGVGPKIAGLVLGLGFGQPAISVDVHVHRVVHRWGLVSSRSPDLTGLALQQVIPRDQWIEVNELLMPFGKFLCTSGAPRCLSCPLAKFCPRIGVTAKRA